MDTRGPGRVSNAACCLDLLRRHLWLFLGLRIGLDSRPHPRIAGCRGDAEFLVEGTVLNHGIPCLGFAFEEKLRVNVWREGLRRLGLPVGPWLREAKRAVRQGAPDHSQVCIRDGLAISLGDLKQYALRAAHGQKIAYVVDLAYDEQNIEKVVALARDADQLFIETPFLDVATNIAAERWHLTARQSGYIAKRARVARLIPFSLLGSLPRPSRRIDERGRRGVPDVGAPLSCRTNFHTRLSKAPAASNDIASWSPPSATRVSRAAIDSVSFVLCRSLKSHNFFIITPCSASMRKAIRKSLACISLIRLYPSRNLSLVIKSTARATR
jgi:hypothetical protein